MPSCKRAPGALKSGPALLVRCSWLYIGVGGGGGAGGAYGYGAALMRERSCSSAQEGRRPARYASNILRRPPPRPPPTSRAAALGTGAGAGAARAPLKRTRLPCRSYGMHTFCAPHVSGHGRAFNRPRRCVPAGGGSYATGGALWYPGLPGAPMLAEIAQASDDTAATDAVRLLLASWWVLLLHCMPWHLEVFCTTNDLAGVRLVDDLMITMMEAQHQSQHLGHHTAARSRCSRELPPQGH